MQSGVRPEAADQLAALVHIEEKELMRKEMARRTANRQDIQLVGYNTSI